MTRMEKEEKYKEALKIIQSVVDEKCHLVSNLANVTAILQEYFKHHWVGFYLVDEKANELYLGPFQGPLACTVIGYDKGVCGKAWAQKSTLNIKNVHEFDDHIACSAQTNSEIVVPLLDKSNRVFAVLDIDSVDLSRFDEVDELSLKEVCNIIQNTLIHK